MDRRQEILSGDLWQLMIKLSVPGILGMLVVSVNSLVDAMFISHLVGSDAFGGVSLTIPLFTFSAAITSMLAAGGSSLYSKAIGNDDQLMMKHLFSHLFILVFTASSIVALAGYFLAGPALVFLGANPEMLHDGKPFYQWAMAGCFTSMMGLTTSALIRAEGNVQFAMKITVAAVLLNIVINPLFIKVFNLGVRGSALATIVSMGGYTLLNTWYFYSGKGHLVLKEKISCNFRLLGNILSTGLPSFIMQVNGFFRQFVLFKLVAIFSTNTVHLILFTAIYRLFSFSAIPVFGMLQAFSPIAGINLGAGNTERVRKAIFVFRTAAVSLMMVMALPGLIFPGQLLSLLIPDHIQPAETIPYFRIVLLALPLMPFASTGIVFLQVSGNSKTASKLTFSREFFIFLPLVAGLTYFVGYAGIYYGLLVENLVYISIVYMVTRKIMNRTLSAPAIIL